MSAMQVDQAPLLVDRCYCETPSGKKKGFAKLETFNVHHIDKHMDEDNSKELLRKHFPEVTKKCCTHVKCATKTGRAKGFLTVRATLAHFVNDHLLDQAKQLEVYRDIDELFPAEGINIDDDDISFVSQKSYKSNSFSQVGTPRSLSRAGSRSGSFSNAREEPLDNHVPEPLPDGVDSCDVWRQKHPGCTVMDYYSFLGSMRLEAEKK
jgi:hypothetical protein